MEDKGLESKKQRQLTEDTSVKSSSSSSSSSPKCHGEQEKVIKSDEACEFDALQRVNLQASPKEDIDGSDVEEEDVKVCDICGDAGREDLLAVCSRCADGAEHTYCMRAMLDKVPEGDWICEECSLNDELEARKQDNAKMLDSSERSKSVGRTVSVNYDLPHKLDDKDSFCESSKIKYVSLNKQAPCKRAGDSIETGVTAKKQALESSIVSPKMSSPGRVAVPPKDISIKSLDKPKRKSTNQISSATESTSESSENVRSPTTSSLHAIKGNFSKSNSFSSTNSKPNVKVLDEGSQKQKQGVDARDGQGKFIGKSMSFKGLGRSNVNEPKVKMLSPKCTPVEELKCQMQARDRIPFERKSTIKLDPSFVIPMAVNTTKRPFRGDSVSTSSVSNNGDLKSAQTDGKLSIISKHASADVKRQLSTNSCVSASVNGTSGSSEAKPTLVSLKEALGTTSSRTADRSFLSPNGAKADVLDFQSEKSIDNSFVRSKQSAGALTVSGIRRGLSSDASGARVKEGMREENKLKAAIEAAMQKKQDIFKKHRIPEKPIDLPLSNTQGNRVEDAVLNQDKDSVSEEVLHKGEGVLCNRIPNSCNQISASCVKQLKVYPAKFVFSSIKESAMTVSAVPEQESFWQGAFEIHRNGKLPDICGGFQAHLSSFASEKVLEMVENFPHKLVLDESTRPCAWPIQFKEIGAHEDNIAVYFFAKDLESYVRSYKILLDYLMKHDLALRGSINGIELLVFPSSHLPDKSQRWNNLFFMWGVFRGRKPHSPVRRSGSLESPKMYTSNMVPPEKDAVSVASSSGNPCLHKLALEDLSISGSGLGVSRREASVSVVTPSNGDCYNHQVGRTSASSQSLSDNSQKGHIDHSQGSGAEECPQSGRSALKDQDQCYEDKNIVTEEQQLVQSCNRGNHVHEAKKSVSFSNLNKHDKSFYTSKVPLVLKKEDGSVAISNHTVQVKCDDSFKRERGGVDNIKNNVVQVKLEKDKKQLEEEMSCVEKSITGKSKLEGGMKQEGYVDINLSADSNMEDFSDGHSTESIYTSQKSPWMDRKDVPKYEHQTSTSKRTSDGFDSSALHRLPSSFSDRLAAQMCGASTSSHGEDTSNKADDEKPTSAHPGSAQRYFFIVDSHSSQSTQLRDDSMSWKVDLTENDDRLIDGSPNLELALGVEKKQSRKGILPFFAGIVDKNDPDGPPDIATPKEEEEDSSASLSLSLAFPFSDKETATRIERPATNGERSFLGGMK